MSKKFTLFCSLMTLWLIALVFIMIYFHLNDLMILTEILTGLFSLSLFVRAGMICLALVKNEIYFHKKTSIIFVFIHFLLAIVLAGLVLLSNTAPRTPSFGTDDLTNCSLTKSEKTY